MSTPTVPSPPTDPSALDWWAWFERELRRLGTPEPWLALLFLVLNFALGIFWFTALVTLVALGGSLVVVVVGIPILAATLSFWVGGAKVERWRIGLFTGRAIPSPYRPLPEGSFFRRARALATDPAVWRDLFYLFLLFPLGIAEFVLATVCFAVPLAFVTLPLYFWSMPGGVVLLGSSGRSAGLIVPAGDRPYSGWLVDTFSESLVVALLGVGLAVGGSWLVIRAARAHALLGHWLLGTSGTAQLTERVETLTRSRSAVVEAQLAERQRIERDLHDGAQQRLVSLAMSLGLAKEKLRSGADPEAARALVEASHDEAKRVLAELRDLVRGIHPAILADRGLDAAVSAVAARSPIPVRTDVRLAERPAAAVEAAAYFVVVEALANVAKHAAARQAWVTISREGAGMVDDRLVVGVVDDGRGGANPARGSGLGGLRHRLAALDGHLSIESPAGGPTWLLAEIPWEPAPLATGSGSDGHGHGHGHAASTAGRSANGATDGVAPGPAGAAATAPLSVGASPAATAPDGEPGQGAGSPDPATASANGVPR